MKMFITKNALTKGIQEAEGEILQTATGPIFRGKINSADYDRKQEFKQGSFHETLEEANLDAQRRVLAKIAANDKSNERLRKLQFVTSNIVG
jgi:hypothetical protein